MALRIKVNPAEFKAACTDGCVYGELRGKRGLYVYAELGMERQYNLAPNDDPNTEYRLFTDCDVYFAKTREKLNSGEFDAE
ncbi:MAG: hypothetical protein GDA48_14705 [Hormoscilla sp. GM102CHS1]|nr:hypothetical protein [Hormoscilla sp. GM102CHS1]